MRQTEIFSISALPRLQEELSSATYAIIQTSHSIRIKYGKRTILLTEKVLSFRCLALMRRLQKEVRERFDDIVLSDKIPSPHYAHVRLDRIGAGVGGIEYDLDQAYLNELFRLGACARETAEDVRALPKNERLATVGSLATLRVTQHIVDGRVEGETERKRDQNLYRIWQTIVSNVDRRMEGYFTENQQVLWYWVDALFSSPDLPQAIHDAKTMPFTVNRLDAGHIHLNDGRIFPTGSCFGQFPDPPPALRSTDFT